MIKKKMVSKIVSVVLVLSIFLGSFGVANANNLSLFADFDWRRPLFSMGELVPNLMPESGPRTLLEADMDALVNQFGQRLFATPNENAASAYLAEQFKQTGTTWDVVHHVWDRSANPTNWPATTRNQPFVGRLSFGAGLPDIYGQPFPNNANWGATIEDAILVDLGMFPNLALPTYLEDVLNNLPEGETLSILGAVRYEAAGHDSRMGPGRTRHQFNVANLVPVINELESNHNIVIDGILLAATGSQDPLSRTLCDYNIESLVVGTGSQNHGMVAPTLQNANNTPRPLITTSLHFLEQAIDRAEYFEYAQRFHRTHDNTVIATRKVENPELIIVLTAHLDSVLASQGAADNASGTAALLEIARHFAYVDLGNVELRLAAVGAHEGGGMTGSRYIIANMTQEERDITINLNMDIIASVGPSLVDGRPIDAISMDIHGMPNVGMPFAFNLPAHLVISSATNVWNVGDHGIDNIRIFDFGGSEHTRFTENGIDAASMIMIDNEMNDLELQYHNSRDNMDENYCYDRLRLSVDLMINAIGKAVDQQVSKIAYFQIDEVNNTLILANAAQMFDTFDAVSGNLVVDGNAASFEFVYPNNKIVMADLDLNSKNIAVSNVISTGVGIADHTDAARNVALNGFASRTVGMIIELPVYVVEVIPSAFVTQIPGNSNNLTITVTEILSNGVENVFEETVLIRNNASGTYAVGGYNVFVNTQGNTQIREIRIVD